MSIKKIPSGDNLMRVSYTGLKGWYEQSIFETRAKGFVERIGKVVVAIPAHLLIGLVQSIFILIYDLAMAIIFNVAAFFTGFRKHSLCAQAACHLSSLTAIPGQIFKNIAAAFCPPCIYKSDNIRKAQYLVQFDSIWAEEGPKLKWDAYKSEYLLSNFGGSYLEPDSFLKEMSKPKIVKYFEERSKEFLKDPKNKTEEEKAKIFLKRYKQERRLSLIPFGDNLMKVSFSKLKSWYEASVFTKGSKGFFERLGKALVVMPAHLLVGGILSLAMAVYDVIMSAIFSLAAFFTGFTRYSFNRRVLGHLGSLLHIPGQALKHIAASFAPPIVYKGKNIKNLQYHFQYEKIKIKAMPQLVWEICQSCNMVANFRDLAFDKVIAKSSVDGKIRAEGGSLAFQSRV